MFIDIRFIDIIDILIVAVLFYTLYRFLRGTMASAVLITIIFLYVTWIAVKALNMELLSNVLGQLLGMGILAVVILFQPEIRKLLFYIRENSTARNGFFDFLPFAKQKKVNIKVDSIVVACRKMSEQKVGALMVIERRVPIKNFAVIGDVLNAQTNSRILETIFQKNTPLHDGAIIIKDELIYAVRCVLPVSEKTDLPPQYGMRHRSALGITEQTDAFVVIVSEQTGRISTAENGILTLDLTPAELSAALNNIFIKN